MDGCVVNGWMRGQTDEREVNGWLCGQWMDGRADGRTGGEWMAEWSMVNGWMRV